MSNLIRCDGFGILYRPPTRPDPSARLERGKAHKRPCVVQPAQKGSTCMDYAMKKVRIPIGKDAPGFEQERRVEQRFSLFRKFSTWVGELAEKRGESEWFYSRILELPFMGTMIEEVKSHEIFKGCGDWESFTHRERWSISQCVLHRIKLRDFQLTASEWLPQDSVRLLSKELKLRGPLYVQGDFGENFYKDLPFLLERISALQFPVYSWGEQECRAGELVSFTHAVCIIGADHEGEGSVYFVDPNDATDPADFSSQKIYTIPYPLFQSKIRNSQMQTKDEMSSSADSFSTEFAFYYDGWIRPEEAKYNPSTPLGKLTRDLCVWPEERLMWEPLIDDLPEEDRTLLFLAIGNMIGGNALKNGVKYIYRCPHITKQAVQQVIVEKYEQLSPKDKGLVFQRCLELDYDATEDFENALFPVQNLPRLADALEGILQTNVCR